MLTAYDKQILREMQQAARYSQQELLFRTGNSRIGKLTGALDAGLELEEHMSSHRPARGQQKRKSIESGGRVRDEPIGPSDSTGPKISLDQVWVQALQALHCQPPSTQWPPKVNRRNFGRELIAIHGLGGAHDHIRHVGAANAVKAYLGQFGIKCD